MIFLTPQSYASPTPGGEEGGVSAKGLKAIVRTMRDDKRERMPRLLSQAMAEELPPDCVRALAEMDVAAHQRFASSEPRASPGLASAAHSAPEAFLARFRDMSTRRLHGYLA